MSSPGDNTQPYLTPAEQDAARAHRQHCADTLNRWIMDRVQCPAFNQSLGRVEVPLPIIEQDLALHGMPIGEVFAWIEDMDRFLSLSAPLNRHIQGRGERTSDSAP